MDNNKVSWIKNLTYSFIYKVIQEKENGRRWKKQQNKEERESLILNC